MIANCALYFPTPKLPFNKVLPKGTSDAGLFRQPTWFEYHTDEGPVRLNLRHPDLTNHLQGFRAYVARLPAPGAARAKALALIGASQAAVGVSLARPIEPSSSAFRSLVALLAAFDGFMFVHDSIMLPDGTFLIGPMATSDSSSESLEPIAITVDPTDFRHQAPTDGVAPERVAARESHYRALGERGFRCSRWLPLLRTDDGENHLRPIEEIARRLLALKALFLWVASQDETENSSSIKEFVGQNSLEHHLTPAEVKILSLPRENAHRDHSQTIGWKLENMWSLAWVLGFEPPPPFYRGQLPDEVIQRLLFDFLPPLRGSIDPFRSRITPRTANEVSELEDIYYCAHNAVRSAQLDESTVPSNFHPVGDGGAVHERRHSLSWALSPGEEWDEVDLST